MATPGSSDPLPKPLNDKPVWRANPRAEKKCYWGREGCNRCRRFDRKPFDKKPDFQFMLCDDCIPNQIPSYEYGHTDKYVYPTPDKELCDHCKSLSQESRAAGDIIVGDRGHEEGTLHLGN
jgi:hypothetical protein